jgi:hypothetical protein
MKKLNLTPEERVIYERKRNDAARKKRMANWTPEQLADYKQKVEKRWVQWKSKLPEEKQQEIHEKILSYQRKRYYTLSPEEKESEKQRKSLAYKNQTQTQKDRQRLNSIKRMYSFKMQVLDHYTNGNIHCMNPNCEVVGGAKHPDSLCVDHVYGGGRAHAKEVGGHVIDWIIKNNFPEGMFQVLCHNCNIRKKIDNKEDYKRHKDWRILN